MDEHRSARDGSCDGDCDNCPCSGAGKVPVTVSASSRRGVSPRVRSLIVRVSVAGGMAAAFVLVALLAEPGRSSASQGVTLPDRTLTTPSRAGNQVDLQGLLGELRGRMYRVEIVAGAGEPTYRVLTGSGTVLAEGLRADEVYTIDEHLTIDRFGDGPLPDPTGTGVGMPGLLGGPLMLLDTRHD